MKSKLRVVIPVLAVLAVVGVLGASEIAELPTRGLRETYRVSWRDGARVIRVQELGEHYALVTISADRVIDGMTVVDRSDGGYSEYSVYLLADEYGHSQLGGAKPRREWWDRMLGIKRGAPREPLAVPRIPTAADGRGGGW